MLIFLLLSLINFGYAQNYPLLISEIMYNPAGNDKNREWIEVVNISNQTFNIFGGKKGWKINDGQNHLFEETTIALYPQEVLVIVQNKNQFFKDYPDFKGKIIEANFILKNESGVIKIYDQYKNIITETSYSNIYGVNGNDYSLIFQNGWREGDLPKGTPGIYPETSLKQLQIKEEIKDEKKEAEKEEKEKQKEETFITTTISYLTTTIQTIVPKTLIISEFFPNPKGNDYQNEFVEIYNYGEEGIDLQDFKLEIGKTKIRLQGIIEPKEHFLITNKDYKFSIRNSGEVLKLLYKNEPIFEISYQGKAPEEKSFARFDNEWSWTLPTPGKENIKETNNLVKKDKKEISYSFFAENSSPIENSFLTSTLANIKTITSPGDNFLFYIIGVILLILIFSALIVFKFLNF